MGAKKNPGPLLTSVIKGVVDLIPAEFRAKVGMKITKQQNPPNIDADEPTDVLVESKVEQTRTDEREKTNTELQGDLETELVAEVRLPTGQTGTRTHSLVDEGTALSTDVNTVEAEQKNLGNGKLDQIVTQAPAVFSNLVQEVGTPDVIPTRFRSAQGVSTKEETVAGTVSGTAPALGAGEVLRREATVDTTKKRTTVTKKSAIITPILHGQELDRRLGIVTGYEERLEDSGDSLGDANTEVEPISDTLDIAKEYDFSAIAAFAATFLIELTGKVNLDLPVELISLTSVMEKNSGNGEYHESGSGFAVEPGGWSLSIPGSGEGSATIIPELIPVFKHRNGRNVTTSRYIFLLALPVTSAAITAKLTSLGVTVSAWPKFSERPDTIILTGQELALQVKTSAQEADSLSGDSGEGYSESSGSGFSKRTGLIIRVKELPPTIHGTVNISGMTSDAQAVSATASSTTGGISASASQTGTVQAHITPTGLSPTANATSVPTSGKYVLPADAEPYLPGYALVHAEVVDFANVG